MEQTNRTMLFEEINPDKKNLLTMISETESRNSLTDDEIQDIHHELEITSFQEFVQKFEPTVHMLLNTNEGKVQFSKSYLGIKEDEIRLDAKASLFQKLLHLMKTRKKRYVGTGFCQMLENMIPKEKVGKFHEVRSQIVSSKRENDEHILYLMKQFDDGILLLLTFIEDTQDLLNYKVSDRVLSKAILGNDAEMQVHVIKKAVQYRKVILINSEDAVKYENSVNEYIGILKNRGMLHHTQLLHDCFLLPIWFMQKKYELIQEKYEKYCELYTKVLEEFFVVARPIIETMLGVKKFFEQYGNTDGMKPKIIVGNFQVSDLLNEEYRRRLELYLDSVNGKSFQKNTIWYAIVPNIASENSTNKIISRERFLSNCKNYSYQRKNVDDVLILLEVLGMYHIQSFFSMENVEKNTFSGFAKKGIQGINEELRAFEKLENKDYVIPCYPNFIVIPKEQSCVTVGKTLAYDQLKDELYVKGNNNVWFDMIGIEASYIAAGLVAACQCPKYLGKHFGNLVNTELPGVAYRFSYQRNNLVTVSSLLSETTEFADEIVADALVNSKGILFGQQDGRMIILTDRIFSYSDTNPLLISMVQTINYIQRIIQYETQDYKKNLVLEFLKKGPESTISKWCSNQRYKINNILEIEEELQYHVVEEQNCCVFELNLGENNIIRSKAVPLYDR